MKIVIAVTGIAGSSWQDSIERVLEPHFRIYTIKYQHIFTTFDPMVFLCGSTLVVVLMQVGILRRLWVWLLVIGLLAFLVSSVRHRLAMRQLWRMSGISHNYSSPHIVAYGFGSQLVGELLRRNLDFRADRIIFQECVLPIDYPWQEMRLRFHKVHNIVWKGSWLPRMVTILSAVGLLRGYGAAGQRGFTTVKGLVENTQEIPGRAYTRADIRSAPPVENIFLRAQHVYGNYAASVLLPLLWGIDPIEYSKWLELNLVAAEHYTNQDWEQLQQVEEVILGSEWKWISDGNLESYIRRLLEAHPGHRRINTEDIIAVILQSIYLGVAAAVSAHQQRNLGWERAVQALNPGIATVRAVDMQVPEIPIGVTG